MLAEVACTGSFIEHIKTAMIEGNVRTIYMMHKRKQNICQDSLNGIVFAYVFWNKGRNTFSSTFLSDGVWNEDEKEGFFKCCLKEILKIHMKIMK